MGNGKNFLTESQLKAARTAQLNKELGVTQTEVTDPVQKQKYDLASLQESPELFKEKTKIAKINGEEIIVEDRQDYQQGLPTGKTVYLDRAEYAPYMDQVRIERDMPTLNKTRAVNQSHWEQFGGFLNQALVGEVIGGTISAIGSIFEIPSLIYEKAVGETSDFNNAVIEIGQSLMDFTKKTTPIYSENPDKAFDIHDPAWWFSNAVSVASAASMLVPAKATMSGISWINNIATKLGKATGGVGGDLLQAGNNMTKTQKALAKQAASALVMRHAENTRESFGVVNDVKAEMLARFDSDEEWEAAQQTPAAAELRQQGKEVNKLNLAEHIASRAGFRSYSLNFSNIIFDFIQAGALLKGNAFTRSKVTDAAVKKELGRTSINPTIDRITSMVGGVASQLTEGLEEAVNYIGEKEGKNLASELAGDKTLSLGERLGTYINDPHMWEAAVWGAAGGVTFDALGSVFSGNTGKEIAAMQIETIRKREQATAAYVNTLAQIKQGIADKKITIDEGKEWVNDAKAQLALSMGMEAAKRGSVNVVLEQLANPSFKEELLASTTTQELQEMGVDDIDKAIAKTIEDVKSVERSYNRMHGKVMSLDIKDTHKSAILTSVVSYDFQNRVSNKKWDKVTGQINDIKERDRWLTDAIKSEPRLELAIQKEALEGYSKDIDTLIEYYNKLGKTETAKDYENKKANALKRVEEINKLHPTLPATTNVSKEIKDLYKKRSALDISIDYNNSIINDYLSPKGAEKLSKELSGFEQKVEDKKVDTRTKQFQDKITKIAEDKNIDNAIKNLELELAGKTKDSAEHEFITEKLNKLKANKEYLAKTPVAPVVEEKPIEQKLAEGKVVYTDEADTEEFLSKLEKELGGRAAYDRFVQAIDNVWDDPKASLAKKIKMLEDRRDAPNQAGKPLRQIFINNQIYLMNQSVKKDLGREVGVIKVGSTYIIEDKKYTITELFEDGNGDTYAVYNKNGEEVMLSLEELQQLSSTGLLIEEKVQKEEIEQDKKLVKLNDLLPINFEISDSITLSYEAIQAYTSPQLTSISEIITNLKEAGVKIEILHSGLASIAYFNWETNTIQLNANALKDNPTVEQLFQDVILHELIHAQLHNEKPYWKNGAVPTERSNFNSELIKLINLLENSGVSSVQDVIENIRLEKNSHPEELLTYLLANQEVFNEIYLKQPAIIEGVEKVLDDSLLKDLLASRKNASEKPRNPEIRITDAAKQLATDLFVNPADIIGTGQNGRITVTDIKKAAEQKGKQYPRELVKVEYIQVGNLEAPNSNNIYLAAINSGILNGQIDVNHYREELKQYNITSNISQAQLETSVRAILDPSLNVGTTVELRPTSTGGITVLHNGIMIGFINNPTNLKKDLDFLVKVNSFQTTEELTQFAKSKDFNPRQQEDIRWKYEEMKGVSTNKPFATRVYLIEQQLNTANNIAQQVREAVKVNPSGKITTKVTRKTSGNLLQVENYESIQEHFPNINEVFFIDNDTPAGGLQIDLVSNKNPNKKFTRNPDASSFFNHDESYSPGRLYILMEGANTIPNLLDTYIPVRLNQSNVSEKLASEAYEIVEKIIDKIHSLKGNHWVDILKNEDIQAFKKQMNEVIHAPSTDSAATDYFKIFSDRLEFNFGNDMTASIYLYSEKNKKPAKNLVILGADGKKQEFTKRDTLKDGTISEKTTTTISGITRKPTFKAAIVKAFTQKRHNVDFTLLRNPNPYKGYDNYLDYLIKNDILLTDSRPLLNGQGNPIKDSLGNPLPAITSKKADKLRNSNLVLSISENLAVNGNQLSEVATKKEKQPNILPTKEGAEKPALNPVKTKVEGDIKAHEVKSAVETLLKNTELIIDSESFSDAIQTSPLLYEGLVGNQIILEEKLPDGLIRIYVGYDNSGITRDKVVDKSTVTPVEKDKVEDVQVWWNKTFGDNISLDNNILGIIREGGVEKWGTFSNGMVRLSQDAPKGTAFHESFHVVFWLYNTDEQRIELLKEAAAKYGNLTNLELEEFLADDFADYMLRQGETKKVDGKIKGFFAKIYNWIKSFFTTDKGSRIDSLFKDINSGKFNYKPDQASVDFAKGITRDKVVEGFTRAEEAEVISLLSKKIIEFQKVNSNVTLKDVMEDDILNPKVNILASLRSDMRVIMRSRPEKGQNIMRVIKQYDEFFEKASKNVKRQFGVSLSEDITNLEISDNADIEKGWDDTAVFGVSQKDSVGNYIKGEIMSTPLYREYGVKQTDTFLGLEIYLDFNKVYPYIQRNMIGALDLTEMLDRLETMAHHDPSLHHLIAKLNNDMNFKAAWVSTFKKQTPDKDLVLYGQDGVKVDSANKNVSHVILGDKWSANFTAKINDGSLGVTEIAQLQKDFQLEYKAKVYSAEGKNEEKFIENIDSIIETSIKTLNSLGVNITPDNLRKIITSTVNGKYYGSPKKAYDRIIYDNVIAIMGDILAQDINIKRKQEAAKKKNVKLPVAETKIEPSSINRFNNIALHSSVYQYDLIESSYFDVKGNNVYATLNPHYLSDFFDLVKAATNPQYNNLKQARTVLLNTLKQFAKDPAMRYSNWLWSSDGIEGALNLVNGRKDIEGLTIADLNLGFLGNWAYSMLDGVKNTDSSEGYQYSTMPDKAWEITQAIMYAESKEGSAKVSVVIPSDSGNISFINASRISGVVGNTVPPTLQVYENGQMISKVNPLFKALKNTVNQEIERMKAARDLLFIYNVKDGTWKPKEHKFIADKDFDSNIHVDLTKLEKNYYWKKQGKVDTTNKQVLKDFDNIFEKEEVIEAYEVFDAEDFFFKTKDNKFYRAGASMLTEITEAFYENVVNTDRLQDSVEVSIDKVSNLAPFKNNLINDLLVLDEKNQRGFERNQDSPNTVRSNKKTIEDLVKKYELDIESDKLIDFLSGDFQTGIVVLKGLIEDSIKPTSMNLPIIATQNPDGTWKPTGNVFYFNNIPAVNNIPNMFHQNMIWADLITNQQDRIDINTAIDKAIADFVKEQSEEGVKIYGHVKEALKQSQGYARYNSFEQFITEYMLNSFINNVEQYNFLVGNQVEFSAKKGENAPAKDTNKRAKQISAPSVKGSGIFADPTYKSVSIKDIELSSNYYNNIVDTVAKSLVRSKQYSNTELNYTELNKTNPDYSVMSDLDKAVYRIVSGYLNTNLADGQGYITVDRYEMILKDYGRWNNTYEKLFKKVRANEELNASELTLLLQPMKPYLYGRSYDGYLNRHTSVQVKYSLSVLAPQLVAGTQLELMSKWMDKNGLGEVQFESAEKVGTEFVLDITDGKGNIVQETLDTFSEDKGFTFRNYEQRFWGIQLDVPDHMMDSENKLGTQLSKLIIGNLPLDNVYNVAGTNYTRDEYIAHYMDVMSQNIIESAANLKEEIGVTVGTDGKMVITNMEKLSKVLMSEVERRGISDNYMEAIMLDENGQFNMPLFINSMGTKWESILTSLFTNRIIDQKTPGGSGVLLSSAFMGGIKGASIDTNVKGIQWSKEVIERGDYNLRMSRDSENGVLYAEVLLPAWSKDFYVKDANGNLVLDSIDNIPDELKTMVSYRIPTESDYSATVFKVVGFLPATNGSTMVLPPEYVTAKGLDFDVDKEFIMYHSFKTEEVNGRNVYTKFNFITEKNEESFAYYLNSKHSKAIRDEIKNNPDRVLRNLQTQITRFRTRGSNLQQEKLDYKDVKDLNNQELLNYLNTTLDYNFANLRDAQKHINNLRQDAKENLNYVQEQYELTHWGKDTEEDLYLRNLQKESFELIENLKIIQQRLNTGKEANVSLNEGLEDIKTEQQRANELVKTYIDRYTEERVSRIRQEFNNLKSLVQLNSRRARNNRILDIFIAKLTHPKHISGVITPQSFDDGKNIIQEIDELTKEKGSGLNPATVSAQLKFRQQNIAGRALKGMAANSNAFLSIAQVSKMYLDDKLGFHVKYRIGELTQAEIEFNDRMIEESKKDETKISRLVKSYNVKELQDKYGIDNVVIEKQNVPTNLVPSKKGKMSFNYGTNKRSDITSDSTFNAIKAGERTATTRYESDGHLDYWKSAKVGDIIEWESATGEKILVRVTKELHKLEGSGKTAEQWSKLEGWSVDYFNSKVKPKLNEAWQIEYEYIQQETTETNGRYVTVLHNQLAWNKDGTFTNVNGDNTMIHASQMLAMILDIVKEGIPFNVNTYTFSSFITMLNTGIDMRYAGMFIRQPVLQELSNTFFETQGFIEDERLGKEIEITKSKYLTRLYTLSNSLGILPNIKGKVYLDTAIANGETLKLSKKQINDLFRIDVEANHAFHVQELKLAIKQDADGKMTPQQEIDFLIKQVKILEMFKRYKKAGEAYDDMIKATGTDRTSVGPSLSRPDALNRSIEQATYYLRETSVEKAVNIKDNTASVYGIGDVLTLYGMLMNGDITKDMHVQLEQGARIFVDVNGTKTPATKAIFPKMFGASHDSVYPVLQTYKEQGFDSANEILSPMFIKQSPAFKAFIAKFVQDTGISYSTELIDKIASYTATYLQNDLEWFKGRDENRVLGLDVPLNLSTELNIDEYKTLSTANKLYYMQNKMKAVLENDTHILNYISPKLEEKSINRNTIHGIEFLNTKTDALTDDRLTDSFQEMWDSEDEFQSELARDLVHYSHLTTGLTMRKNSFSKLIPTRVFEDIKLNDYLYKVLEDMRNPINLDNKFFELKDKFIRSNWNDSRIVPYVYTKYSNGSTLNNTPLWNPNPKTGVLQISLDALMNEPFDVVKAQYVTVPFYKTRVENGKTFKTKIKDVLYKKYKVEGNTVSYVPVDKLGNRNIIEFNDRSIIKDNRTAYDIGLYESVVDIGKPMTAKDLNTVYNSFEEVIKESEFSRKLGVNQAEKKMFMTATDYIGNSIAIDRAAIFAKAFESRANQQEYMSDSLVMVTAPTIVPGSLTAEQIKARMFGPNLQGVYSYTYNVIKAGGTIMMKSNVDSNGKSLATYEGGQIGNEMMLQHFDGFIKVGKLYKKIENDIAYYRREPFDIDNLSDEEIQGLEDSEYNPNGNC